MKLTTDLNPVPVLRLSGAVPLLPQYAFLTWTSETLLLHILNKGKETLTTLVSTC
jgi:hypothetical protein